MRLRAHADGDGVCAFQSTHPLRGATSGVVLMMGRGKNFNPRTPCGVRRGWKSAKARDGDFNPRTPCGVRLSAERKQSNLQEISIHAPLAGCDAFVAAQCGRCGDFNPRTPCGVRRRRRGAVRALRRFQSTHPLRGATNGGCGNGNLNYISIHAPLAGCDFASA